MPSPNTIPVTGRVVLLDVPGQPLALALHDDDGQLAAVQIEPGDLLLLAADAITSGRRRLVGGGL